MIEEKEKSQRWDEIDGVKENRKKLVPKTSIPKRGISYL